jgi:uncharacterized protein
MIISNLRKHWSARRDGYSLVSWLLCIVRSLRVLVYYREHQALCALGVYRDYVAAPANDDLFHHLSHRDYLVKNLSARERVRRVLTHYRFEEATFNSAYKRAVYLSGGLTLWQHSEAGSSFRITLAMGSRMNAEGELTIALLADGKCLHRLSFSWIDGATGALACPVIPFITRNQGRWIDSDHAFAAFEQVFPHNSPSFFCFAAMQGVAQALQLGHVLAIKSEHHVAFDPNSVKHFANAYDGFWKILGGVESAGAAYLIALPFYVKPLSEMAGKHRKRAAGRRENWSQVGSSARLAMRRSLLSAAPGMAAGEALHEQAEA